jgi:hypothetical protein
LPINILRLSDENKAYGPKANVINYLRS